jgi:hypothetical protein
MKEETKEKIKKNLLKLTPQSRVRVARRLKKDLLDQSKPTLSAQKQESTKMRPGMIETEGKTE